MRKKVEILKKMYLEGKITVAGLRKAVEDGVITEEEYSYIIENK